MLLRPKKWRGLWAGEGGREARQGGGGGVPSSKSLRWILTPFLPPSIGLPSKMAGIDLRGCIGIAEAYPEVKLLYKEASRAAPLILLAWLWGEGIRLWWCCTCFKVKSP